MNLHTQLSKRTDRDLIAIYAGMLRENYKPGILKYLYPVAPEIMIKVNDLLDYMTELIETFDKENPA